MRSVMLYITWLIGLLKAVILKVETIDLQALSFDVAFMKVDGCITSLSILIGYFLIFYELQSFYI
jgi:hypothetical protein